MLRRGVRFQVRLRTVAILIALVGLGLALARPWISPAPPPARTMPVIGNQLIVGRLIRH